MPRSTACKLPLPPGAGRRAPGNYPWPSSAPTHKPRHRGLCVFVCASHSRYAAGIHPCPFRTSGTRSILVACAPGSPGRRPASRSGRGRRRDSCARGRRSSSRRGGPPRAPRPCRPCAPAAWCRTCAAWRGSGCSRHGTPSQHQTCRAWRCCSSRFCRFRSRVHQRCRRVRACRRDQPRHRVFHRRRCRHAGGHVQRPLSSRPLALPCLVCYRGSRVPPRHLTAGGKALFK